MILELVFKSEKNESVKIGMDKNQKATHILSQKV